MGSSALAESRLGSCGSPMPHPRILVCADLHLGRASAWLEGPNGVDRSAVGAWGRLVDAALDGEAVAVAIAGDVFDGMAAYFETRDAFAKGVRRLKDAGIPVVAVAGNHDHEALPRFALHAPDCGLTLLGKGGRWEAASLGGVTFVGWSFPREAWRERAFDRDRPALGEGYVVGLVHGDLAPVSAYHPISVADLEGGASAWVLGHVHLPRRVGSRALYPGSPQALDFGPGERGAHGFYWLVLRDGRIDISDLQPLSTVRFDETDLEVDVPENADAYECLLAASEARAEALRMDQPELKTVQLRIRAALVGCDEAPIAPSRCERSRDGRDAFEFTEIRKRSVRDPWDDAAGADVAGEVARLLLGAEAMADGMARGKIVNEEWIEAARQVVDGSMGDVSRTFRETVGRVTDEGHDGARRPPNPIEARELATRALIAELEAMRV